MSTGGSIDPADGMGDQWVRNTRLFRHRECMKREITLHKWYESERAGYDIGWERASVDYMIHIGHRGTGPGA